MADQNRVTRVAVPDISMGIYGYPVEEAVPMLAEKALWLTSAMVHL
ncbi:MAG: hypothetical protein FJ160_00100 [Gammaproteobacteria bacterium]|nr:hypothetical protein [Gammaproteobacteria bacterium]